MKKWKLLAWEIPVEKKEVELSIQDTETYEFKNAKAILYRSRDDAPPDVGELWIYNARGQGAWMEKSLFFTEPWYIKVLEIEEEEVPEVKVVPKKIALGRMRGTMLETLIRQREEKEKPE